MDLYRFAKSISINVSLNERETAVFARAQSHIGDLAKMDANWTRLTQRGLAQFVLQLDALSTSAFCDEVAKLAFRHGALVAGLSSEEEALDAFRHLLPMHGLCSRGALLSRLGPWRWASILRAWPRDVPRRLPLLEMEGLSDEVIAEVSAREDILTPHGMVVGAATLTRACNAFGDLERSLPEVEGLFQNALQDLWRQKRATLVCWISAGTMGIIGPSRDPAELRRPLLERLGHAISQRGWDADQSILESATKTIERDGLREGRYEAAAQITRSVNFDDDRSRPTEEVVDLHRAAITFWCEADPMCASWDCDEFRYDRF